MIVPTLFECQPWMEVDISYVEICEDGLDDYCIYSLGITQNQQLININKSFNALSEVYLNINEADYKCRTIDGYPDTIYCTGPIIQKINDAWVEIYLLENNSLLARGIIDLPSGSSPAPSKESGGSSYP